MWVKAWTTPTLKEDCFVIDEPPVKGSAWICPLLDRGCIVPGEFVFHVPFGHPNIELIVGLTRRRVLFKKDSNNKCTFYF